MKDMTTLLLSLLVQKINRIEFHQDSKLFYQLNICCPEFDIACVGARQAANKVGYYSIVNFLWRFCAPEGEALKKGSKE